MFIDLGKSCLVSCQVISPLTTRSGSSWRRAGMCAQASLDSFWIQQIAEVLDPDFELLCESGILVFALLLVIPDINWQISGVETIGVVVVH